MGLELLVHKRIHNITIQGGSTLLIRVAKKLYCGTNIGKFMTQYRLGNIISLIEGHMLTMQIVEFNLLHISVNKVDDRLANEGVSGTKENCECKWVWVKHKPLKSNCARLDEINLLEKGPHREEDIEDFINPRMGGI